MLKYLTRDEANTGKKMILDSDEGEFYLNVTNTYSDQYRQNKAIVYKSLMGEDLNSELRKKAHAAICAGAVSGWSLPEDEYKEFGKKCTIEAVTGFLFKYPQIAEAVDIFSSNEQSFIEKK